MKKLLTYTIAAAFAALLIAGVGFTDKTRYQYYEMVDGNYVQFKMTADEIAAEDAARERMEATREAAEAQPMQWAKRIELPESGRYIEFPMSAEEIRIAKYEEALASAEREAARQLCLIEAEESERRVIEMVDANMIVLDGEGKALAIGAHLADHSAC